jgi:hypothetical protein
MLQHRWDDAIRQFQAAKAIPEKAIPDTRSKSADNQRMLDQYIQQAETAREAERAAARR